MKKLEFKLKAAVGPFIPYENFYWHRRWVQMVSMSFDDYFTDVETQVSFSGATVTSQSVALFSSQLAYNTIKTGVETPYPVRTTTSRLYHAAFDRDWETSVK